MRLTPHIHLVGSGSGGLSLTDPFDCHVYLVDGGSEAALIDAGIGHGVDGILAGAEAAGVLRERIRRLLLTHAHPDHAGGAARLRQALPGLEVIASPPVARWVREGDEQAMSLAAGQRAEFYPADYRFVPCPVDREVRGGEVVTVGVLGLRVVDTPGHADGHLSYLAETPDGLALFGGDLIFFGGEISLENNWDCRIPDYAMSMGKLRGAGIDAFLPGHHSLSLRDGQRHVDAANRRFDRGFVPRSVV